MSEEKGKENRVGWLGNAPKQMIPKRRSANCNFWVKGGGFMAGEEGGLGFLRGPTHPPTSSQTTSCLLPRSGGGLSSIFFACQAPKRKRRKEERVMNRSIRVLFLGSANLHFLVAENLRRRDDEVMTEGDGQKKTILSVTVTHGRKKDEKSRFPAYSTPIYITTFLIPGTWGDFIGRHWRRLFLRRGHHFERRLSILLLLLRLPLPLFQF